MEQHPTCPILGASKGFSRTRLSPTPELYFAYAMPLLVPAGGLLIESMQINQGEPTYQAISLLKSVLLSLFLLAHGHWH